MLQWFDTILGLIIIISAVSLLIMILTQIIILNLRGICLKKGLQILMENADVANVGPRSPTFNRNTGHPTSLEK